MKIEGIILFAPLIIILKDDCQIFFLKSDYLSISVLLIPSSESNFWKGSS